MVYEPDSQADIRERLNDELRSRLDEPALDDVDVLGALAASVAAVGETQEASLETVSEQSFLLTATDTALTRKAAERGIQRRDAVKATGVVTFSRDSAATTDYVIPSGTRVRTDDGSVTFETTEQVTLANGETSVSATVRAVEGGADGNLPADKLTTMPSPPTGVESVTNGNPTGDEQYTDTNDNTLVSGADRETDEALRSRALNSLSFGGAATPVSIESALQSLDAVRSVTLFTNATDTTDGRGLPPYSSEVIIAGGNERAIGETLRDTVAVTELFRLQGGVIGTAVQEDVYVDAFDQNVTVDFSRPVSVDITIDVTVETTDPIDSDSVSDAVVEYVGGTRTDGSTYMGLGAGENVYISQIEQAVLNTTSAIRGITDLTVDATGDGTDDRETNADGSEVITLAQEEQAFVDAANVTITTV